MLNLRMPHSCSTRETELGFETGLAEAPSQGHALNEGDDASDMLGGGNLEGFSSRNCSPEL
jgi:hypothetical protein